MCKTLGRRLKLCPHWTLFFGHLTTTMGKREKGKFYQRPHLDFDAVKFTETMVTFTETMVKFIEPATAALQTNIVTFRVDLLYSLTVRSNRSLSSLKCQKHEANSIFSIICINFDVPYMIAVSY